MYARVCGGFSRVGSFAYEHSEGWDCCYVRFELGEIDHVFILLDAGPFRLDMDAEIVHWYLLLYKHVTNVYTYGDALLIDWVSNYVLGHGLLANANPDSLC